MCPITNRLKVCLYITILAWDDSSNKNKRIAHSDERYSEIKYFCLKITSYYSKTGNITSDTPKN